MRSAPAVTGPWSAAQDAFTPPESTASAKPFVYAAKAHRLSRGFHWINEDPFHR